MKDFKLRLFKNLFLRFINKSAFTAVYKIKLVEMPVSRWQNRTWLKPAKIV